MRNLLVALLATSAFTTVADAADKVVIGPAPAWVKPVERAAAPAKVDDAPLRVLLSDQQAVLEPGRQTVYFASSLLIQTPQGLGAGNVSLPWRPETDVLTVHKLVIRRGSATIDVLGSGQSFTVLRREQNLESSTLDGVLTANIQPEGLQVGDTLEFAASISSSDPTMKGHVEQIAAAWNGFPIARAHLRLQWPTSLPIRLRQTAALPALKVKQAGGMSSVELALDNVEPVAAPKGAPPRYGIGRLVEVTDFASWADLGALMAPFYEKAASIPAEGPLRTEVVRIQALSTDPKARAEAALALVQDRVRYVALAMGAGGYVPADAQATWARRYGDCKGKTALLLALLHAMQIEAELVAVSTVFGDGLDARLPMVGLFNHVLVRATIAGRTYWLDGTRTGDTDVDRLPIPNFGWGLPLRAQNAALVRMLATPLTVPTQDVLIRIDGRNGLSAPAPTTVETIVRGDEAIATNAMLANLVGEGRDRALKEYWRGQYDFIDVAAATATFDRKLGELRLSMTGTATMDWNDGYFETDGTGVGYKADFSRDPGPDRDAPFSVAYPYFTRAREMILLPKDAGQFAVGKDVEVDQTAGGIHYRRHATIADGVFTIEKTERSVTAEFPASEAAAQQAALRRLNDQRSFLRAPASYRYSSADLTALAKNVLTTASAYVERAETFMKQSMLREALLDAEKAIELDPRSAAAWSMRGLMRAQTGDLSGARSDLAKAEAIDPDAGPTFIGRAVIAEAEFRPRDAVSAYTKALARNPDNPRALIGRGWAYARLGERDKASADLTALVQRLPNDPEALNQRAALLLAQEDYDGALADFDKSLSLQPSSNFALATRAITWARKGNFEKAAADLDAAGKINSSSDEVLHARAIFAQQKGDWRNAVAAYSEILKRKPGDVFALANRAQVARAAGDDEMALADAAAAIKLEPDSTTLYLLRANILKKQRKEAEAIAEARAVTAANPDDGYAHVVAAKILSAYGRDADAMQAYAKAIAIKPEAYIYLNRRQSRATADEKGRQADLEAALKLDPTLPEAVGEKARQQTDAGDFAGAVASLSPALDKVPDDVGLLLQRGVAYARQGDAARANIDFAKASEHAIEPSALNELCWAKGLAGVALESALADCNAALAKEPLSSNYLDSRGLVLLRLGKLDDAIADYGRALSIDPEKPTSLYGRAIAWARKGDRKRSERDSAAAVKLLPGIRLQFERFGLEM